MLRYRKLQWNTRHIYEYSYRNCFKNSIYENAFSIEHRPGSIQCFYS